MTEAYNKRAGMIGECVTKSPAPLAKTPRIIAAKVALHLHIGVTVQITYCMLLIGEDLQNYVLT